MGPLQATLGPLSPDLYAGQAASIFYNDQPTGQPFNPDGAHAKGVLVFGAGGGFWITHSLPDWPGRDPDNASFATVLHPQLMYGQHALCLSLPPASIEEVARVLLVARPK
jgi:deoxyribonuclease-2